MKIVNGKVAGGSFWTVLDGTVTRGVVPIENPQCGQHDHRLYRSDRSTQDVVHLKNASQTCLEISTALALAHFYFSK